MGEQNVVGESFFVLTSAGAIVLILLGAFLIIISLIMKVLNLNRKIKMQRRNPKNKLRRLSIVINSILAALVGISAEIAIAYILIK